MICPPILAASRESDFVKVSNIMKPFTDVVPDIKRFISHIEKSDTINDAVKGDLRERAQKSLLDITESNGFKLGQKVN